MNALVISMRIQVRLVPRQICFMLPCIQENLLQVKSQNNLVFSDSQDLIREI